MAKRFGAILILLMLLSLLFGCDADRSAGRESASAFLSAMNDQAITKSQRSSAGTTLTFTLKPSPQIIVKDAKGKQMARISTPFLVYGIVWSQDGRSFLLFTEGTGETSTGRLYAYSATDRKARVICRSCTEPEQHGRYVLIGEPTKPPRDGSYQSIRDTMSYRVLDSANDFRVVLRTGRFAGMAEWSPDSRRFCFLELVNDEYGDLGKHALSVADLTTGKAHRLLVIRRRPRYAWFDNDSLAVTTYNNYAVPTISLYSLNGKVTKLVTAPQYMYLTSVRNPKIPGSVVYEARTSSSQIHGDIWAVKPGEKPVRVPSGPIPPGLPRGYLAPGGSR